jgi:hypothetical protein
MALTQDSDFPARLPTDTTPCPVKYVTKARVNPPNFLMSSRHSDNSGKIGAVSTERVRFRPPLLPTAKGG